MFSSARPTIVFKNRQCRITAHSIHMYAESQPFGRPILTDTVLRVASSCLLRWLSLYPPNHQPWKHAGAVGNRGRWTHGLARILVLPVLRTHPGREGGGTSNRRRGCWIPTAASDELQLGDLGPRWTLIYRRPYRFDPPARPVPFWEVIV